MEQAVIIQPTIRLPALQAALVDRRDLEESLSLSDALSRRQSQNRSESFSSSSQDILAAGAMDGSARQKQSELDASRQKRLEAYMSIGTRTVAMTKGWRIRAAYRLTCYMARVLGGLQGTMMLADLLHARFGPDPSFRPFTPPVTTGVYGAQYILDVLQSLKDQPDTYSFLPNQPPDHAGFTYLPPPIPDAFFNQPNPLTIPALRHTGLDPEDYDPEMDEPLLIWLDAYSHLSGTLRIHEGTETEPQAGVFGTVGMFSTNSARLLWPTRDELLLYEEELMLRIFDHLCEFSVQRVEGMVMESLGYGRVEAVMLVKTALRYGTNVYEADIDMAKIRELKSLDIISDAAKDSTDPRAQIAARKQFQLVAGLTKDSSSDAAEQFRALASKVLEDEDDLELLD